MVRMIFTKHARWYCGVTTAVDEAGRLRAAVFLLTPRERRFVEFREYCDPNTRRRTCIATVLQMYEDELWYRRPRVVFCRCKVLARNLRREAPERLRVRTNRNERKFATADGVFKRHARRETRCRQWCSSGRLVLRK